MATSWKDTEPKSSSWVSCPACSCDIALVDTRGLTGEFSVPCPNCGQRKVYRTADVHDSKPGAQAIKALGRKQFATTTKSIPSGSWLDKWASAFRLG
jgi:predicted RNA-binding Zn-ribbon protein involved in translation (DUF1610 family)